MSVNVPNDQLWHTPIKAYSDYLGSVEKHGLKEVLALDEFQKVRETKVLAVLCFALYMQTGTPWYLQLDKSENTDGRIMRQSPTSPGTSDMGNVEITSYMLRTDGKLPSDSLLDQLKKTKAFEAYHKYGEHDLVLVDLGNSMTKKHGVDFDAIAAYLREIEAPYGLWAIEQVEHDNPDTIIQITTCTPEVERARMNGGEAWHQMLEKDIRGTRISRRTGDPAKVGIVMGGEPITRAVWEFE